MSNKGFTYTLKLDAEINDLLAKTAQVKKGLETAMAAGKAPGAEQAFSKLEQTLTRLQEKASQPITSLAEFNRIEKDVNSAVTQIDKLGTVIEDLGRLTSKEKMELLPPDLKNKIAQVNTSFVTFQKAIEQASKKSQELTTAESKLAKAQEAVTKEQDKMNF